MRHATPTAVALVPTVQQGAGARALPFLVSLLTAIPTDALPSPRSPPPPLLLLLPPVSSRFFTWTMWCIHIPVMLNSDSFPPTPQTTNVACVCVCAYEAHVLATVSSIKKRFPSSPKLRFMTIILFKQIEQTERNDRNILFAKAVSLFWKLQNQRTTQNKAKKRSFWNACMKPNDLKAFYSSAAFYVLAFQLSSVVSSCTMTVVLRIFSDFPVLLSSEMVILSWMAR